METIQSNHDKTVELVTTISQLNWQYAQHLQSLVEIVEDKLHEIFENINDKDVTTKKLNQIHACTLSLKQMIDPSQFEELENYLSGLK